jgi:probable F420-dependent oxidoreductase
MRYDRPGARIERMAESLAIMRALWASAEPVDFAGEHFTITGAVGTPQPCTPGGPPVCIGGGGRRMLSLAAREADIVGVNPTLTAGELGPDVAATATPAAYDEKIGWIRDAAGARFDEIELQCHCAFVMVTPDTREIAGQMAAGYGLSAEEALDVPITLFGTVEELCDMVEARRDRYGFTYWVVPDSAMDAFAPVVARLVER